MNAPTIPARYDVDHPPLVSDGTPLRVIAAFVEAMSPTPDSLVTAAIRLGCSDARSISSTRIATFLVQKYKLEVAAQRAADGLVRRDTSAALLLIRWKGHAHTWQLRPSADSTSALRARRLLVREILHAAAGGALGGIDGVCAGSNACFESDPDPLAPTEHVHEGSTLPPWLDWIEGDKPPAGCVVQIGQVQHFVPNDLWAMVVATWEEQDDLLVVQPAAELNEVIAMALGTRADMLAEHLPQARLLLQGLTHTGGVYTRAVAPDAPTLAQVAATLRATPRPEWMNRLQRTHAAYFRAEHPTLQSLVLDLVAIAVQCPTAGSP